MTHCIDLKSQVTHILFETCIHVGLCGCVFLLICHGDLFALVILFSITSTFMIKISIINVIEML